MRGIGGDVVAIFTGFEGAEDGMIEERHLGSDYSIQADRVEGTFHLLLIPQCHIPPPCRYYSIQSTRHRRTSDDFSSIRLGRTREVALVGGLEDRSGDEGNDGDLSWWK